MASGQHNEVEVKFKVDCSQLDEIRARVMELGGEVVDASEEEDVYLAHPCRDLLSADEALRVRYVDGRPRALTYKGPRTGGPYKSRSEITLAVTSDPMPLLESLGFSRAVTVTKFRIYLRLGNAMITVDNVRDLGCFVEVESLRGDPADIDEAVRRLDIRGERVNETYAEMALRRAAGTGPAATKG